jgi:hypothetical protein
MSQKKFEDTTIQKSDESFKIVVKASDGQLTMHTEGKVEIAALTSALTTILLKSYNQILGTTPKRQRKDYKMLLFDLLNQSFSGTLRLFAPEIMMRPDLTEDAIRRAEDQIIDDAYEHAPDMAKAEAANRIMKAREAFGKKVEARRAFETDRNKKT